MEFLGAEISLPKEKISLTGFGGAELMMSKLPTGHRSVDLVGKPTEHFEVPPGAKDMYSLSDDAFDAKKYLA